MAHFILLSAQSHSYFLLATLCALASLAAYLNRRKPRVPTNLPILKISTLPDKLGEAADIKAYDENGAQVVQTGYSQYSKEGHNFLMRTSQGLVFVAAPRFIEEIRTAPDNVLSGMSINNATLQVKYTLHHNLDTDWYEFDVIQKQLTQTLGPGLLDVVHECSKAFSQYVERPTDWTSKPMWPIATRIVTRTANRILFGEKLAENDEFLQLCIDYTYTVFGGANAIRGYASWLRPLILRLKTNIASQRALAKKLLSPVLEERIRNIQQAVKSGRVAEYEADNPNDLIQWILDITPPEKLDINVLIYRILHVNTAAIHTSSVTFLNAVYDLALHPEIHEELRREITGVMYQEGNKWTKQGLTKMVKLDSFMKESARWNPFLAGTLERRALRDFELSDGTTITKGTKVTVPHYAMFFDEEFYGPTAGEFDAFRFSKMRASKPSEQNKHSFVQCTPTFAHFGYGKHACPGRFFAAAEIKVLLVYMLSVYDIRFPKDQPRPAHLWYGGFRISDTSVNVEWKLRERPLLQPDLLPKL